MEEEEEAQSLRVRQSFPAWCCVAGHGAAAGWDPVLQSWRVAAGFWAVGSRRQVGTWLELPEGVNFRWVAFC